METTDGGRDEGKPNSSGPTSQRPSLPPTSHLLSPPHPKCCSLPSLPHNHVTLFVICSSPQVSTSQVFGLLQLVHLRFPRPDDCA